MDPARKIAGKTALITGATAGIGYELAKLCAKDGYDIVIVARNSQRLSEIARELGQLYNVAVKPIAKDLSLPASAKDLVAELERSSITVDLLINNAGFGLYGAFVETDIDTELEMMQLNMVTLTYLTKLLLREMCRRGQGKILNVASIAGFQPGPLMAIYYASKAYVVSFSEATASELKGSGVTVTTLCPGSTQTDFHKRAKQGDTNAACAPRMPADVVARAGYDGLMLGARIIIPGVQNKLLMLLVKLLPRTLVTRFVLRINSRKQSKSG